jgi:gamma-glutamyl-gamma-aminobutyrate hydrolase PuuD
MSVIGITACRKLEDYRQSILHVGGEVRIIETSSAVSSLDGIDGLLLTGGEDVAPARYGQEPHASVVEVNPERDQLEVTLIAEARRLRLPILGICRGIQILNVACGGTLVQDIPSEVSGAIEHSLTVPPHQPFSLAHEVWLEKDTLLSRLMRERLGTTDTCEVNSRHHQAVGRPAAGFVTSATAPDGVVEALEDPEARFCLGVQWHPEFHITASDTKLFAGLIAATRA